MIVAALVCLIPALAAACGDSSDLGEAADVETNGLKLDEPFKFKQTAQTDFVPEYIAKEKGFFSAYNLDVEMVPVTVGGTALMPLLAGGQIDVTTGVGVSATMLGISQGADVVGVGSGYLTGGDFSGWEYVVREDSDVDGPEDMGGLRVATQSAGATPDVAFDAWVKKAGVDPSSVTKVPMPYANMPTALLHDQVDVIQALGPAYQPWAAQNKDEAEKLTSVGSASDVLPTDALYTAYAMRRDFVKDHPDVVKAWLAAMTDAVAWIKENPDEAARIVESAGAIGDAELAVVPNWTEDLCIDGTRSREWIDMLEQSQQIDKGTVSPEGWFTNDVNPAACA